MVLNKRERNTLFTAIAATALDPSECEYRPSQEVSTKTRIVHSASNSTFLIEELPPLDKQQLFNVDGKVGDELLCDLVDRPISELNIRRMATLLYEWANLASQWVSTPDLWESNRSGDSHVPGESTPDSVNDPFAPDEQAAISARLKAIAESVKKDYDLTAEQSAKLDEKFEEAEKASRRMGRKDWGLLFGGAVFSLILSDVITPGIAGHILMMVEHGLGHLFTGGPPSVRGIPSAGRD